MKPAAIVGAGLAGLVAAHAWPQLPVLEAAPAPFPSHRAVLRFRSEAVSALTGIPFRRVRVRKGIWHKGFVSPTIADANLYAQKVTGRLVGERSIWNLDPVDRFIAPPSFYEQLVAATWDRVHWGEVVDFRGRNADSALISTAPLPAVLQALGPAALGLRRPASFERAPIRVRRYRVPGADVFQTIYFPSPATAMYRASITGDLLIIESVVSDVPEFLENRTDNPLADLVVVTEAFGLSATPEKLDDVEQRFGKIVPLDEDERKGLLFQLTHDHSIFSLGRFATWRNILLDDVVEDIAVIKRLLRSGSRYDLRVAAA